MLNLCCKKETQLRIIKRETYGYQLTHNDYTHVKGVAVISDSVHYVHLQIPLATQRWLECAMVHLLLQINFDSTVAVVHKDSIHIL